MEEIRAKRLLFTIMFYFFVFLFGGIFLLALKVFEFIVFGEIVFLLREQIVINIFLIFSFCLFLQIVFVLSYIDKLSELRIKQKLAKDKKDRNLRVESHYLAQCLEKKIFSHKKFIIFFEKFFLHKTNIKRLGGNSNV